MLQIGYAISEISNRYAFVSDLSNWNGAVFPSRRKEWIRRTGKLMAADTFMLKKFGAIHKTADPLLFLVFFDPRYSDPWQKVSEKIGPQKTKELKKALDHFDARFLKIWIHPKEYRRNFYGKKGHTSLRYKRKECATDKLPFRHERVVYS